MQKKSIFTLLIIALMAISCEKEIEYKGKIKPPILVLNGYLTPDSIVKVNLAQTRFLFTTTFASELTVKTANVKLYVNNRYIEQLTHTTDGEYIGTYQPQVADHIKIEASAAGFPSIEANTQIPQRPNILLKDTVEVYETTLVDEKERTTKKTVATLLLKDQLGENYYYCTMKEYAYDSQQNLVWKYDYDLNIYEFLQLPNNKKNPSENFSLGDDTDVDRMLASNKRYNNVFRDHLFEGKEVKLIFPFHSNIRPDIGHIDTQQEVQVKHYLIHTAQMSKDIYLFIISSEKARQTQDSPFAEGVQVYSNVKNGTGLLGSYAIAPLVIKVEGVHSEKE